MISTSLKIGEQWKGWIHTVY